jgi:hypothetical protein
VTGYVGLTQVPSGQEWLHVSRQRRTDLDKLAYELRAQGSPIKPSRSGSARASPWRGGGFFGMSG